MSKKSVRRSLSMTPAMRDRLAQLVGKQPRDVTEADLIREAIRQYLDEQEDLIGSRKHFQKSLRERVDQLESALAFQLNVLIHLLATDEAHLRDAIIAAKEDLPAFALPVPLDYLEPQIVDDAVGADDRFLREVHFLVDRDPRIDREPVKADLNGRILEDIGGEDRAEFAERIAAAQPIERLLEIDQLDDRPGGRVGLDRISQLAMLEIF